MAITLTTSFYYPEDYRRLSELRECLKKNFECRLISQINLMCESDVVETFSGKIVKCKINQRPTYQTAFDFGSELTPDAINIFANSDIYFDDENLQLIERFYSDPKNSKVIMALTRWDIIRGKPKFFNRVDSQDVWIWKGIMSHKVKADFLFGVPGCDNSIAHQLQKHYTVINPSLTIKTYHLHESGIRTYGDSDRIEPPYHFPQITTL